MAQVRSSGQVGGKPPGPKQDAMPINHTRSQKAEVAPGQTGGGAHPSARRALGAKASAHAKNRTAQAGKPGAATSGPGATPVGGTNMDSFLNQSNPMDQDAGLSSGSDFTY